MYQPKNILVTGGCGFIGSNFIEYILASDQNANVINFDLLTYAADLDFSQEMVEKYPSRYEFIKGDICDEKLLLDLFCQRKIDTVVHFAAESHVDNSLKNPDAFLQTNIIGTHVLLKVALEAWKIHFSLNESLCRFHHVSTDEVYGTLTLDQKDVFDESSPYRPNSPYSASKASSDHMVRCYYQSYKLPITITNTSNNFGPRQHKEKFIPTIIRACMHKRKIPVYGNGTNVRDWLFVTDHCEMLYRVIQEGIVGENYNIGGDNELNNIALCTSICDQMNKIYNTKFDYKQLISFVKDRPGHDRRYAIDMQKYRENIGKAKHLRFIDALNQTIRWYIHCFSKTEKTIKPNRERETLY